jgi:hypothetical protein
LKLMRWLDLKSQHSVIVVHVSWIEHDFISYECLRSVS